MQSKKISVFPSQSLSLQHHNYQNEYWVIVNGIAHIYLNNETSYKIN